MEWWNDACVKVSGGVLGFFIAVIATCQLLGYVALAMLLASLVK